MFRQQKQDQCVFENETRTLLLEVFDENNELFDLSTALLRFVVWQGPDGATLFSKTSANIAEILIDPDQVANKGQAKIFVLPTDVPDSGVFIYNIWVDLAGGEQHLIVVPSRFEVLIAKRS